MRLCIHCNQKLQTKHQKKFCSLSCAAQYNNTKRQPMTTEQKKKISDTLKQKYQSNEIRKSTGEKHSKAVGKSTRGRFKVTTPNSILELSTRTQQKIIRRMKIPCVICGWNESTTDIHHIIPKKAGGNDDHKNLTIVCPNHHRMIHTGKIDSTKLKSIYDIFGDKWKDFYYG